MKNSVIVNKIGMRDESFNAYMRSISKKVMSKEEEQAAFKRLAEGDTTAYNEIVESNLLFVVQRARHYANSNNLMELIAVGNMGIIDALETFDYTLNNKFISHAVWYINRRILNYLLHKDQTVRKSNNAKVSGRINKIKRELFQQLERVPSIEEIKDEFRTRYQIEIKDDSDLFDMSFNSIDEVGYGDEDDTTFAETASFTDKTASVNEYEREADTDYTKALVEELFKGLRERDVTIMKMLFGIGYDREYTIEEVADVLDLTKERVRQIKNECQSKMKKFYKRAVANVG